MNDKDVIFYKLIEFGDDLMTIRIDRDFNMEVILMKGNYSIAAEIKPEDTKNLLEGLKKL